MPTPQGNQSFTTAFTVRQTAQQVYAAINNVKDWWSQEIDGQTDSLGAEFRYHFKDLHRCTIRVTEQVPDAKIVWKVLENYFSFTQDKTEWTGTKMVFEITGKDGNTEVQFTHAGLVPACECYNACADGWGYYINQSLRDLIETGKGHPNAGDAVTESERGVRQDHYTTTFSVTQTPRQIFSAINNVRGWWTGDIDGRTSQLGDEFTYRFKYLHYSKHKITEWIPDRKVVWRVTEAKLEFVGDQSEWVGTKLIFEIYPKGDRTEVRFTHAGLNPAMECYEKCSNAWNGYVKSSLRELIVTGKGWPDSRNNESGQAEPVMAK